MTELDDDVRYQKFGYHFRRSWWIPVAAAIIFGALALSAGGSTESVGQSAVLSSRPFEPGFQRFNLVSFATTAEELGSSETIDQVTAEAGADATVVIESSEDDVITIGVTAATSEDAQAVLDAFVDRFRSMRVEATLDVVEQFTSTSAQQQVELQRFLDEIDALLAEPGTSSEVAIALSDTRAEIAGELALLSADVAGVEALAASAPEDFVVTTGAATAASGFGDVAGMLRLVAGVLAGLLLGGLWVAMRAYLDTKVRSQDDLAHLEVPVLDAVPAGSEISPAAVEIATTVGRLHSEEGAVTLGLLGVGKGDLADVADQVRSACTALAVAEPEIDSTWEPSDRLLVASRSTCVAVFVVPGAVTRSELRAEVQALARAGTRVIGVSILVRQSRRVSRPA